MASIIKDNILKLYRIEDSEATIYKICIGRYKDSYNTKYLLFNMNKAS